VLFIIPPDMPALPERRSWIMKKIRGAPPMSLYELGEIFQRIANDTRPKGVILHLRGFNIGLADVKTLRDGIQRLRQAGKQVVSYIAPGCDLKTYYVASVTDAVLVQPDAGFTPWGMRLEARFLKDALEAAGLQFDVVAISPYKTAGDMFTRNSMSPEYREQINRLVDSFYATVVNGIAESRHTTSEAVRQMIDNTPYTEDQALAAGFIDGILNEEDLAGHLGVKHIITWEKAGKVLRKQWRKKQSKYVALVQICGTIIDGKSSNPPISLPIPFIGGERAGDLTVTQHVRKVMQDKNAAALLLYVDSGGGSATSSEAMAAAMREFGKERPVVVYMNNVAGSGGYYVATPGQWIVAQPTTITGSIGVLSGKFINRDLYGKLRINREEILRGANAAFLAGTAPFTESQREKMRQLIEVIYGVFLKRVADSRRMTPEEVAAIGGGRVWTGAQALANGLVDELGGLDVAVRKARELAGLPDGAPLVFPKFKDKSLPPQLAEQVNPAAALLYLQDGIQSLGNGQAQFLSPFVLES